jgi:hypothetical protein
MRSASGCSAALRQRETARQALAEATTNLNENLPEECRRAGCQPGWIR